MQAKANKKQTFWVLLIALALIALCTGGLWAYIKSADAKFGIQEAAAANLPQGEGALITREKYDSYPLILETTDVDTWSGGFGLMRDEKDRLESLKAEYASGKRPTGAAPSLPAETGFAILPLDPNSFGGIAEYYFLPVTLLTDEQLLQLIAYSAQKGTSFTAGTLTVKNSTRGDNVYRVNRLLSAGESERQLTLAHRCIEEGLAPDQAEEPALSLPVSGVTHISLIPKPATGTDTFAFYPFRELNDEELLLEAYRDYKDIAKVYTWLDASEEEGLSPTEDNAWMRSLLEDVSLMPISAQHIRSSYVRKEATGEIHLMGVFESARVNGKKTNYSVTASYPDRQLMFLTVSLDDQNNPDGASSQLPETGENINDPKWAELAKKTVERIDSSGIEKVEADSFMTADNGQIPCIQYIVNMRDGGCYALAIRLSDGGMNYIIYAPVGPDPFEWVMKNSW
jgi:hypothetical protein